MYRKMLVLLDGSELAEVVFPFAKELAARLNLDVTMLQVYGDIGRNFVPVHRAYIERAAIVAEAKRGGGFTRRACQAFFRRKFEQSARESHGLAN